ncbi:hypothetical protein D9M71_467710 [compost metagenome]
MDDVPTETELLQHAGAEVLDQDVRVGQQLLQDLAAFRVLEVEGQRALVARLHEPPQRRAFVQLAPFAQRVAAVRRFDLDHLGAEFGADARGERAGDQGAEFDHFQAGEGFGRDVHRIFHSAGNARDSSASDALRVVRRKPWDF